MADEPIDAFTLLAEAASADVPIVSKRAPGQAVGGACRHRQSHFDRLARRVWCRDCGVDLDPIAVIADLAGEWDRLLDARRETARLHKEIADLEAQRKRLRDAVRRAEKGAVPRG